MVINKYSVVMVDSLKISTTATSRESAIKIITNCFNCSANAIRTIKKTKTIYKGVK